MLLILAIGLMLMWQRGNGAPHVMPPTAVAVTLLIALLVDFGQVGPGRWPDKLAFLLATPAIREGFDGSPIDEWTIGRVHDWIQDGLDSKAMHESRIAEADVNLLIGAAIGLVWLYALFCLLPSKMFSKKLGRAATLQFPASRQMRLNPTMWTVAIVLGLGADLPGGALGVTCRGAIDLLTIPITAGSAAIFGT